MIPDPFFVTIRVPDPTPEDIERIREKWDSQMRGVVLPQEIVIWREPKRASLRAFYIWLLVAFLAGAVFGAVLSTAFAAGGSSSSPGSTRELVVEGTAARTVLVKGDEDVVAATSMATPEAANLGEKVPPPVVDEERAR